MSQGTHFVNQIPHVFLSNAYLLFNGQYPNCIRISWSLHACRLLYVHCWNHPCCTPSFPTLVVNFPNLFEFESWIFSEQYPLLCIRSFALTKKLYHICSFTACCSAVSMRWFKGWETIYYCKSINRIHICSTMFHYFPIVDPSFDYFDCRSNCLVKSTRLFVDIPRKGPVRLKLVQTARYPP
jgi:hypothetical protein